MTGDLRDRLDAAELASHIQRMPDGDASVIVHSNRDATDRALAVLAEVPGDLRTRMTDALLRARWGSETPPASQRMEAARDADAVLAVLAADPGDLLKRMTDAHLPIGQIMRHDWLREHVVPSLPIIRHDGIRPFRRPFLDCGHPDVKPISQIAAEIRRFIVDTPDVELWGWYCAYDHVCLAQLFGPMSDLPAGIPMWTNDLKQEHLRLGEPPLPEQESGVHNALADARHIKAMAEHLARTARTPEDAEEATPDE